MTENEVIRRMRAYFRGKRHEIVGESLNNSSGVDLAVRLRDGRLLFVEAKGLRKLQLNRKRLRSQLVWDNGYARLPQLAAGRKCIRNLDGHCDTKPTRPDLVGLAVPDDVHFREHSKWFLGHMRHSGFGLWFVADNGRVSGVLAPVQRRWRA